MADINILGIDRTTGQSNPVRPGDTVTDTSGNQILGGTGLSGLTGMEGVTGIQGITGIYGQTGIQGVTGFVGSTGIQITTAGGGNGTAVALSAAGDGQTLTLPAGALSTNGSALWVIASGTCSGSASVNIFLQFGATDLIGNYNFPGTNGQFQMTALVIRTGAATQVATCQLIMNAASHVATLATTPAETLSGSIILKTGLSARTSGTVTWETLAYHIVANS